MLDLITERRVRPHGHNSTSYGVDKDKLFNAAVVVACILLAGALIAVRAVYEYLLKGLL